MKYHEFVGQVQHRGHFPDLGSAVKAIRVVLQALGARLQQKEREHLAAQLPEEIAYYLKQVNTYEKYDLQEFYTAVGKGEGVDYPDAIHHAKAVATTVQDAVTAGETRHVSEQLPPEFAELFERQYEEA